MRRILLLCTAIAAHKPKPPPPPPMAPPTIPLSKPSTRAGATCSRNPKDHGNSRQLGNHINDWYFGYEKGFSAASHHPQTESGAPNCFEAYLLQHLYKDGILQVEAKDRGIETFPSAEDLATLRDAVLSHTSSVASFAIYYPEGIKKILPEFSAALRSHMLTYARDYDPGLLNLTASFGPRHCVVHYRVGDVASQNAKRLAIATKPRGRCGISQAGQRSHPIERHGPSLSRHKGMPFTLARDAPRFRGRRAQTAANSKRARRNGGASQRGRRGLLPNGARADARDL